MKFKKTDSHGKYKVIVDGIEIGEVWKVYKYGLDFWKNSTGKCLFGKRKEAGEDLCFKK